MASQPGWTHFHLSGWKDVVERVYGHECVYLAERDGAGALTGILPLVRVKSVLFGHFLVSLPFVNYGGPLGTPASVRRLTEHAAGLAAADGAGLLELRARRSLPVELPVSHRKVTVVLRLPRNDPDALWRGFPSKLRSQVRRPEKEGAVARFGPDQIGPFFRVFARNMRDLGTPTPPRRLFDTIGECFPDDVTFGCVYLGDVPVAAGCGLRWGDEFEMTWASALRAYNRFAPNMLLYWSFMRRAAENGLAVFNFGRCSPGGGTHRFKRQWGGEDEPLWWYRWSAPANGKDRTPSPESNGAYALAARVWRRLPASVTDRLGPRIARCIP